MRRLVVLALLAFASVATASDAPLAGSDGHPRDRLPLTLHVASFASPSLDLAANRAVDDWNRVARETFGVDVFTRITDSRDAQVVVVVIAGDPRGPMGVTHLALGSDSVIALPIRIDVRAPAARGQTSRETVLYQVLAHELGHALGLVHTTDPRSLMCCVHESLNFNDPAIRDAYVESRRKPDVSSVRAQLSAHYERFWRK
jgi:hypothetical protein